VKTSDVLETSEVQLLHIRNLQKEETMFEQVFESLRTATTTSINMQQELFNKWLGFWPGVASLPTGGTDQVQIIKKKWVELTAEMVKKQRETLEAQFKAGLKNIDESFRLAKAKDPEELRAKTVELWQKSVECMRQMYEAQLRDFQAAVGKWTELMTKGAA